MSTAPEHVQSDARRVLKTLIAEGGVSTLPRLMASAQIATEDDFSVALGRLVDLGLATIPRPPLTSVYLIGNKERADRSLPDYQRVEYPDDGDVGLLEARWMRRRREARGMERWPLDLSTLREMRVPLLDWAETNRLVQEDRPERFDVANEFGISERHFSLVTYWRPEQRKPRDPTLMVSHEDNISMIRASKQLDWWGNPIYGIMKVYGPQIAPGVSWAASGHAPLLTQIGLPFAGGPGRDLFYLKPSDLVLLGHTPDPYCAHR